MLVLRLAVVLSGFLLCNILNAISLPVSQQEQESSEWIVVQDYSRYLYFVRPDGSDMHRLPNFDRTIGEWAHACSPDGEWVAFSSREDGVNSIFRIHPNGQGLERVSSVEGYAGELAWSPDGQQFAYVSTTTYPMMSVATHVLDIDSPDMDQYASGGVRPSWSPDGRYLVTDNSGNGLYITDVESGETRTLTFESTPRSSHRIRIEEAAWSPTGEWIAFVSDLNHSDDVDWASDLFLVHPDGTELHQITADADEPAWSPDGEWLVFVGYFERNLYRVRIDGSDLQMLAFGRYGFPQWCTLNYAYHEE